MIRAIVGTFQTVDRTAMYRYDTVMLVLSSYNGTKLSQAVYKNEAILDKNPDFSLESENRDTTAVFCVPLFYIAEAKSGRCNMSILHRQMTGRPMAG